MANFNSTQIVAQGGVGGGTFAPLDPDRLSGRVRISSFDWTVPAGVAQNDTLIAMQVPAGARLVKCSIFPEAGFVATGVKVGFNTGVVGDDVALHAGMDLSAGTEVVAGNTYATALLLMPTVPPAPGTTQPPATLLTSAAIMLTFSAAAVPLAGKHLTGYITWVLD